MRPSGLWVKPPFIKDLKTHKGAHFTEQFNRDNSLYKINP